MRVAGEMAQWVKHLPHKREAMGTWVLILVPGVSARLRGGGAQTNNAQGLSVQPVQPE